MTSPGEWSTLTTKDTVVSTRATISAVLPAVKRWTSPTLLRRPCPRANASRTRRSAVSRFACSPVSSVPAVGTSSCEDIATSTASVSRASIDSISVANLSAGDLETSQATSSATDDWRSPERRARSQPVTAGRSKITGVVTESHKRQHSRCDPYGHPDHWGLAAQLPSVVPLLMGRRTAQILRGAADYGCGGTSCGWCGGRTRSSTIGSVGEGFAAQLGEASSGTLMRVDQSPFRSATLFTAWLLAS